MNLEQREAVLRLGRSAELAENNEAIQLALDTLKAEAFASFLNTPELDHDKLGQWWSMGQAVVNLENKLDKFLADAKVEQDTMKREEYEREHGKPMPRRGAARLDI